MGIILLIALIIILVGFITLIICITDKKGCFTNVLKIFLVIMLFIFIVVFAISFILYIYNVYGDKTINEIPWWIIGK